LAGDQTAEWGYHVDHWFPERFERTLKALGFESVNIHCSNWETEPYLCNVEVIAIKKQDRLLRDQLRIADQLLWESTVADAERPMHEIWRKQLREFFGISLDIEFIPQTRPSSGWCPESSYKDSRKRRLLNLWDTIWPREQDEMIVALKEISSRLPLNEIQNFNQLERDLWVAAKAQSVQRGATVLDVGAGTCRYRNEFSHCQYKAQDFKQYEGYRDNREGQYGQIDYISDITAIPVASGSSDVILCTEVLEHITEPIAALEEMARILRPGGRLFITAPLGSGLHQLPYHFYGGFTPYWYRHFCPKFQLSVIEVVPNGGFFKLLAQECARVAWTMPQHEHVHGKNKKSIDTLFGEVLPRFLFALEDKCMIDQFTVGYHVEAKKNDLTH
jgi:SAM-dependent methyltransferase